MADNHKVMKDQTGQLINETLKDIRNVLMENVKGIVYGFHIDSGETDPEDCVTYLRDAVGMTPAKMDFTSGVFNYGSWFDAFFMPKPCMLKYDGTVDYYLDHGNYAKKEDGTASDIATTSYGGNAMMEWGQNGRKIWYKIVPDTGDVTSASVYVADYQADPDFVCWSFVNNQGDLVDHFYTPIYNGTLVNNGTNDVLRSLSGMAWSTYGCKSKNATQERTAARHNNDSLAIWDTEVYCDIVLINILLILISKSLDSQTAFGKGLIDSGNETVNNGFTTGVHNAKGLFFGTSSGTASTYTNAVKVFGMENWWGFQWRRFGGLVNVSGTTKYKMTRGTQDGSSAADYVVSTTGSDYSGYITGGAVPSASGTYIQTMTFDSNQFVPNTAAGDSTKNYCDGLWTNNGQTDYASRGGGSSVGAQCGAFCLALHNTASHAGWHLGASPSCKPLS